MKRLIAIFLTSLMIISVVPFAALAEENQVDESVNSQSELDLPQEADLPLEIDLPSETESEDTAYTVEEPTLQSEEDSKSDEKTNSETDGNVPLELPVQKDIVALNIDNEACTEEEFKKILSESEQSTVALKDYYGNPNLDSRGYHYTYLTNDFQRKVYNACYNTLSSTVLSVKVSTDILNGYHYKSTAFANAYQNAVNSIWKAGWCFRYDNPKVADPYTSSISYNPNVLYNTKTGKIVSAEFTIIMYVHKSYTSSLNTKRDNRIVEIANLAMQENSVYARLKSIYQQIIKASYYDYRDEALESEYSSTQTFFYAHSSYGILNNGVGVCESYAKAFKMVCDYMDLAPCILLISETHMWNAVYLEGKWYGLDATWGDIDKGVSPNVYYDYFLCKDPDIVDGASTDHIIDYFYIVGPQYADEYYVPKSQCNHIFNKTIPAIPATTENNGKAASLACSLCGLRQEISKPIYAIKSVSISKTTYNYTGGTIKPTVTVKDKNGKTVSSSYYTLSYSSGCKNPGSYKVTVKFKGNYSGTVTKSFKIVVGKPTVKFTSSTSYIKIYWSKVKGTSGYAVYSSSKKLITRKNITSYTFKKLKSGRAYNFYVRSYKTISGKRYYSDYVKVYTATRPTAPKVSASSTTSKINYSWKKVSGASGYIAYNSSKRVIKDRIATIRAYASGLSAGRYYTFYFRAYKNVGSGRVYSSMVKVTYSTRPKFSSSSVTIVPKVSTKLKLTTTAKKIYWSSSNKSIVTVSSKGYVTGKKYGTATITAKANGQKAYIKVKVTKASIKLGASSITLKPAYYQTLTVKTTPSTAKVYWKSSNTSVATVSSKGVVTAKKEGTSTVTAYFKIGSKYYSAKCKVTVKIPTYSKYGTKYSSVPDFSAAVGKGDYCYDSYTNNDVLYLWYDYDDINWDGKLSATLSIYESYLYAKGFKFYQNNAEKTAYYFLKGDLLLMIFFDSSGDVVIAMGYV